MEMHDSMTHQLAEIFFQCFILKNFCQFSILKKTVDKVKNIYTTFLPILLWHLHSFIVDDDKNSRFKKQL